MDNLLKKLVSDEKKIDRKLYSSGPYWNYKNSKAIIEINRTGLDNFRGLNSGIGTSYADNLVLDVRNEFNVKGRLIGKFLSLPLIKTIFNAQLHATNVHIDRYLKNLSIVYKNNKNVINLLNKYKFEKTTSFGCVQKFIYNKKEFSTRYLEMADVIDKLGDFFDFSKINSFFEIGGGFGANIHFLLTNFPNIKKIIYLDTVPNIYVGTQYLKNFFGNQVKDYLHLRNFNKIDFSLNNELEILCIPPWLIEKLGDLNIDHFHNANSFVEMPENIVKNYCDYLKKLKVKEISLISYDNFDPKTTFNPEKLNNFFENKLKVSWFESIIEEYNRKQIFLTN